MKHNALAAITCIKGPPCVPGKMAELSFLCISSLSLARINPPLGPLNVLCVVVVTTSAWGMGEGYSLAATKPETCAISTKR